MKDYLQKLLPDQYYHIYNHAVGGDNLFVKDENYNFFLKKYIEYISPIADTFAYCLMPNHFHFAIKIKSEKELAELAGSFKLPASFKSENIAKILSKQFGKFFSSYTQSLNKQQKRKGALFEPKFKRIQITTNTYFLELIHYIHNNPINHGFVKIIEDWKYSSYNTFFYRKRNIIKTCRSNKLVRYKREFCRISQEKYR